MYTADALSRSPLPMFKDVDNLRDEAEYCVNAIVQHLPSSDGRLEEIKNELKQNRTKVGNRISRQTLVSSRRRFLQLGNNYFLLAVDYCSRDVEVCRVDKTIQKKPS